MLLSHNDFLSFHPEEQSLGRAGDELFLELRHRIMTADFGPGSWFLVSNLADACSINAELAVRIARALHCHGYVIDLGAGRFTIKGWSDTEFHSALKKMRESQRSTAQKYTQRMSDIDLRRLSACLDFRLSMAPGPHDIEIFYIRWWMFFHCTLHAYGMQSFRTLTLTITPPYLRRRLITALPPQLLNATFDGLRGLLAAFDSGSEMEAGTLVDAYMDQIEPVLIARNQLYNCHRSDAEIDYSLPAISGKPLFLPVGAGSDRIDRGYREPLNWEQFMAMNLGVRMKA